MTREQALLLIETIIWLVLILVSPDTFIPIVIIYFATGILAKSIAWLILKK